MISLGSSLRERAPEETLALARGMAAEVGVTRVTDTTRLDRVGVPVFASIRPDAAPGSLCVNAGKGLATIDAKVGAYMEAIEFAWAEPRRATPEVAIARFADLLDGDATEQTVFSFCPVIGRSIRLDGPLACVAALDLVSGEHVLVPAELVLMPYVGGPGTGIFGSTTNGLCSGNSEDEATLHGLLELVERDVRSFHNVLDRGQRVNLGSLPPFARALVDRIEGAGLALCVRSLPNELGLPVFEAIIFDQFSRTRSFLNGGYGAHLHRDIALTRAITEAVQSRLSWIHGGRDDLAEPDARERALPRETVRLNATNDFARACQRGDLVSYDAVPDVEAASIPEALERLFGRLEQLGLPRVCRVRLNPSDAPLAVVRVLIPGLEYMQPNSTHRCGPRLYEFSKRVAK